VNTLSRMFRERSGRAVTIFAKFVAKELLARLISVLERPFPANYLHRGIEIV